jgi:TolB-like protein
VAADSDTLGGGEYQDQDARLKHPSSRPAIRTLLLCDLVASTQLVERVGDAAAADVLSRHDRIARDLLAGFHGLEIDKSDGFLLLFERPIEAVGFALGYQARLRELGTTISSPLTSRVGIHVGEVVLRENLPDDVARGAKPLEVEGLAKAVAARVMSLAGSGRILLTRAAYDLARRSSVGTEHASPLRWVVHGLYQLAGVEDAVEICEVAAPGDAALPAPENAEKARRADDGGAVDAAEEAPAEPLIAVLAFDNLSSDPEMQFFSDGVSEEIIQRLSRGANLKVIGRTSSFQFRGEQKAEAAGSLGCSHVLDGSVQRAAGRVRISASLVETQSLTTMWSDRYDRSLEDIFAVQDEISKHIALSLHQAFSSFSTRAVDPADYDLYLRASPQSYAPDGPAGVPAVLAAPLPALQGPRGERRPRVPRGGAGPGARPAEHRRHARAVLRPPAVRTVHRDRSDDGADPSSAGWPWHDLHRLGSTEHRARAREPRGVGARA